MRRMVVEKSIGIIPQGRKFTKKKHQTYQTNQTWIAGTTPPTDRLCETGVGMEDHLPLSIINFLRATLLVGLVIFHQITSSCSYGNNYSSLVSHHVYHRPRWAIELP